MNNDDRFFADFAKELHDLIFRYFPKETKIAIAFAPPSDAPVEVKYIMNVQKPVGIALFEAAADLARKELDYPMRVVNPEKIAELANEIIAEFPQYHLSHLPISKPVVIAMIEEELKRTLDMKAALMNVKKRINPMV
jgi:hypothetical protein